MTLASIWLAVLAATCAVGALFDVLTRKLPNLLCGVMLLAGLGFAFAMGGWSALGLHFAHAALALAIGYALFMMGVFGGGDGKFYAAAASFFSLWDMAGLIVAITGSGLVLAIVYFGGRRLFGLNKRSKGGDFAKLPYGVAIAAGAIINAVLLLR